jgi:hypothetical protein
MIASMAEVRPGTITVLIPIAKSKLGKARKISKICEKIASIFPPKYPEIKPKKIPRHIDSADAIIPTESDI